MYRNTTLLIAIHRNTLFGGNTHPYVLYLRILLSSSGEEDFQRFALNNYVQIIFGYYFADNVDGATIWTNFHYICAGTICEKYVRILFSSFGEDYQRFLHYYVQIVCDYYSTDNVGGTTI